MTIGNKVKHIRHMQTRDYVSSSQALYNCGGFALGTLNWYLPYDDYYDIGYYYDQYNYGKLTEDEAIDEITSFCVKYMLGRLNGIRIIKDENEISRNEYAVAFRIAFEDDDFHYLRRSDEGIWYHKMGSSPIQPCNFDIYDTWHCGDWIYEGPIIMFAIRKDVVNEF